MIKPATLAVAAALGIAGTVTAVRYAGPDQNDSTTSRVPGVAAAAEAAPRAEPIGGDLNAGTFREIAAAQMPTVVSVSTITRSQMPSADFFGDPSLRRFFGLPEGPTERLLQGAGSGFVMDGSGLVLTNAHVVQNAERIDVTLFTDPAAQSRETRRYSAKVLGRDPLTDAALLQLEGASGLAVARLGNSDSMRPGDWVVAIGNPFALSHTVTVGVISATSRPFPVEGRLQRVLQTDAAVNPGNSGGPLINLRGEVIGINTAIVPGSGGTNVGVGFAVPINLIRDLIPQLRQGDVQHGRLGVQVRDVPVDARSGLGLGDAAGGVLVAAVEPDGPAARAGLLPGDVILKVDGEVMDDAEELVRAIGGAKPGTAKRLTIRREGAEREIAVTLEQLTSESASQPASRAIEKGLGLTLSPVTPDMARRFSVESGQAGAIVTEVLPGSPAAAGGVQAGDVVLEVNRQRVTNLEQTVARLRTSAEAGTATFLLVMRQDQRVFLVIGRPR